MKDHYVSSCLCVYGITSAIFVLHGRHIMAKATEAGSAVVTVLQQSTIFIVYLIAETTLQRGKGNVASESGSCKCRQTCDKTPRCPHISTPVRKPPLTWTELKATGHLGILMLLMVWSSNCCLAHSTVASYVIARASTLFFNLGLSALFLRRPISSFRQILGCLLVVGALLVGEDLLLHRLHSEPDGSERLRGTFYGLLASLCQAIFSNLSARAMNDHPEIHPFRMLGHYTLVGVLILWFYISFFERSALMAVVSWTHILVSGALQAVVAVAALKSLSLAHPVSVNLVGYLKSAVQSLLAGYVLKETLSAQKLTAITMTIAGSLLYYLGSTSQRKVRIKVT